MIDPNLELLATCEEELATLRQECARLPIAIDELEAAAAAARGRIEEARVALEAVEKRRRGKEAEIADGEARRSKLLGQSALVKTNAEYTALLREIDDLAAKISETEEEVLLAMEEADALRARQGEVQREESALEVDLRRRAEECGAQLEKARERLVFVERERDTLLPKLGAELERSYRRVAARGGAPVAKLVGDTCGSCHRSIPPETRNRVRKGELQTCLNCLAILLPPLSE